MVRYLSRIGVEQTTENRGAQPKTGPGSSTIRISSPEASSLLETLFLLPPCRPAKKCPLSTCRERLLCTHGTQCLGSNYQEGRNPKFLDRGDVFGVALALDFGQKFFLLHRGTATEQFE